MTDFCPPEGGNEICLGIIGDNLLHWFKQKYLLHSKFNKAVIEVSAFGK
jgi:hypothetical protein